jgi:hypothetical protein
VKIFFVDMGEGVLQSGIFILIVVGLHERHAVQRRIWVPTRHLL